MPKADQSTPHHREMNLTREATLSAVSVEKFTVNSFLLQIFGIDATTADECIAIPADQDCQEICSCPSEFANVHVEQQRAWFPFRRILRTYARGNGN